MHKYILTLTLALAVNQAQANWFAGFGDTITAAVSKTTTTFSKNNHIIGAFAVGALVSGLAVYLWQSKYVISPLKKENDFLKKDNEGKDKLIKTMSNPGAKPIVLSQGTQNVLDALEEKKDAE